MSKYGSIAHGAGASVTNITQSVGSLPGVGIVVPPLAAEQLVSVVTSGPEGQSPCTYNHLLATAGVSGWQSSLTGTGTVISTTDVPAGVVAVRCRITVGVVYSRQVLTIQGTAAATQPRHAQLLGRFIAGAVGGGIIARGARIRCSCYRTVEAAGQADIFVGWRLPNTAGASGMWGFEAADTQASWHCVVRNLGGAALLNVDTGLAVADAHTLDLRIASNTATQPFAQWIVNGVEVATQTGVLAGWNPIFPNELNRDWAPMVGCEKRAPSAGEVSLWTAANDTTDYSWLPV